MQNIDCQIIYICTSYSLTRMERVLKEYADLDLYK